MRHFLLARELPAVFTACCACALFAFAKSQLALGGWLSVAALWCALLWLILFRAKA